MTPEPTTHPDRDLIDRMLAIDAVTVDGRWHRQCDPRRTLTEIRHLAAPGRWRGPGDPGALHLSSSRSTAWAELHRVLDAEVDPAYVARRIGTADIAGVAVVDLTDLETAAALACTTDDLVGPHADHARAIARAAEHAGRDGVLAPSAAIAGERTLVVFRHALHLVTEIATDPEVYAPPRLPPP